MAETRLVLQIEGMDCEGCAQGIQQALKRERGVKLARVDWRLGVGEVTFDSQETSQEAILDAPIFRRGYKAQVSGDTCCD